MSIGALNCTAPLQRVLVRRPSPALSSADPVKWHYADKVDYSIAQEEHDALVAIIKEELPSCEILYHDTVDDGLVDAMFVHDPLVITSKGAILFNMGKELRKREPDLLVSSLEKLEIPILARLSEGWNGKGEEPTMEGGDMLWLDDHTVCIGIGFRTNMAGVEALRAIFRKSELEIEVLAFDLPCVGVLLLLNLSVG